jgi:hypothetical protein
MKTVRLMLATATAVAGMALAFPAQTAVAQAPKPPTDARRALHSIRSGELNYTSGGSPARVVIPRQVRDFDLTGSFVNPEDEEWAIVAAFRAREGAGSYLAVYDNSGAVGIFQLDAQGEVKLINGRELSFSPAVKTAAGQTNELGLYVRGTQALLFVNKTYIDTWDVSAINDFGELQLFASGKNGGKVRYSRINVRVPANAVPPASAVARPTAAPNATNIVIKAYSYGYETHGRPAGMDTQGAGCGMFDDGRPVRSFQVRLNIQNNTGKPMKPEDYYAFAVKPDGKAAFTCFYRTASTGLPEIPAGDSRDITVQAFIEQNESIQYVIVETRDQGLSNRLTIK